MPPLPGASDPAPRPVPPEGAGERGSITRRCKDLRGLHPDVEGAEATLDIIEVCRGLPCPNGDRGWRGCAAGGAQSFFGCVGGPARVESAEPECWTGQARTMTCTVPRAPAFLPQALSSLESIITSFPFFYHRKGLRLGNAWHYQRVALEAMLSQGAGWGVCVLGGWRRRGTGPSLVGLALAPPCTTHPRMAAELVAQ